MNNFLLFDFDQENNFDRVFDALPRVEGDDFPVARQCPSGDIEAVDLLLESYDSSLIKHCSELLCVPEAASIPVLDTHNCSSSGHNKLLTGNALIEPVSTQMISANEVLDESLCLPPSLTVSLATSRSADDEQSNLLPFKVKSHNFPTLGTSVIKLSALEEVRAKAEEARESFKVNHNKRKRQESNEENTHSNIFSETEKKQIKRLQTNRDSAAAARIRREVYIKLLEEYLNSYEVQCYTTKSQVAALTEENDKLRGAVKEAENYRAMNMLLQLQLQEAKIKLMARSDQHIMDTSSQNISKGLGNMPPAA